MKLTDFMINDVFKKYKGVKFSNVILRRYMHDKHKSFLYVALTTQKNIQIHLTIDSAYPAYEVKRLTTPEIVYIFDRLESVKSACEMLNFLI